MRKDIGWNQFRTTTSMKITHIIMTGLTFFSNNTVHGILEDQQITFGSARIKDW